jgi:hypothetical protein
MTTLCLCDFVDVAADRKLPLLPAALAAPQTQGTETLVAAGIAPQLLPRNAPTHTSQECHR